VGPHSAFHQDLVKVLEMARIEALVPHCLGSVGRPPAERAALARALVAKAVFNITAATTLIERVTTDKILRPLCGWKQANEIPSEATFSRAFAEFAARRSAVTVARSLDRANPQEPAGGTYLAGQHGDRGAGETTEAGRGGEAEIQAWAPAQEPALAKAGGEQLPEKEARRLERQPGMSLEAMLADLPRHCAVGTKHNAKSLTS
jgi:hypothetical protein